MSATGPVAGAQVLLFAAISAQGTPRVGAATDASGHFDLGQIPEGRYLIQVAAEDFALETLEWLVTAGKGSEVNIRLTPSTVPVMLDQIEIKAPSTSVQETGAYAIAIEKTLRIPANFFDPLRLVGMLPGVAVTNDQGNAVAIRGYSPNAMIWRLEGLDIVNPNHLANAGTFSDRPVSAGGGVSMLSSQVLGQSNFRRDALPLAIGNALSGALDMSLRKGNRTENEYTVQAGVLGIDIAAEGPVGQSGRTSFVADARYSTIGLLGAAGVNFGDEQIDFSDVTFHLNTDHRNGGDMSVFGFAGTSRNRFTAKDRSLWVTEKDRYNIDFSGTTFGIGVRDERPVSNGSLLRWGLALSGQLQRRESASDPVPFAHVVSENFRSDRMVLSSFINSVFRISRNLLVESGLNMSIQQHDLQVISLSSLGFSQWLPSLNGTWQGVLLQPYTGFIYTSGKLEWHGGLRYMDFTGSRSEAWEPRFSVVRRSIRSTWSAGYGLTHQQQQTSTYLQTGNTNLPFTRSKQWFLEHQWKPVSGLTLRNTVYTHRQEHVPWTNSLGSYSAANQFDEILPPTLNPDGSAENNGWETMVEKRFDAGYYVMTSGSLYRSRYQQGGSAGWQEARFSGRYSIASAAGKEWQRKRQVLGVHARLTALGGQRTAPIDEQLSAAEGTTVFDYASGYSIRLADYFRMDLRLAWRKNLPGRTRTLSLDIQNVLNRENAAGYYFDTFLQQVQPRKQLGIIPVISWRLDF